ncbi:hypothetical protein [Halomicronema hongdechloris]|uniref:hypothetical protein n=1 Tax=Halomicronema hongdechloris TaxID=1209493 RepID=UPI001650FF48|nr:hypothetical protein [Halomicronema hongdechloris]
MDPVVAQVTICNLQAGRYDDSLCRNTTPIQSQIFPALTLTAAQVLSARLRLE